MKKKITKGVILAGGKGTRLAPLTKITNKHLVPVFNQPMIHYPIKTLVEAGITDILIISGKGHAGHFLEYLESGKKYDAKFHYAIQEEAGGIAQAIQIAQDFCDNEHFIAILGDNILDHNIKDQIQSYENNKAEASIFLKEVSNPSSYGVAEIENDSIINIVEKPKHPKSNLAVIGVYMFGPEVFNVAKSLKPSDRGELEITDVNNYFLKKDTLSYEIIEGWWGDAGESFESLMEASMYMMNKNDK
jgi:glucose-1-phosphate thymidylyltransferase